MWEGEITFAPTRRTVQILLDAGPEGPTASQGAFFTEFTRRYSDLLPGIVGCISSQGSGDADRATNLDLVCIDLQSPDMDMGRCELTLEDRRTSDLFSVELRSWQARPWDST